jgi:hypothetical protein
MDVKVRLANQADSGRQQLRAQDARAHLSTNEIPLNSFVRDTTVTISSREMTFTMQWTNFAESVC